MSKKQASAPMTWKMGSEAFRQQDETSLYWLGSGGILINARGTCLLIDPVLGRKPEDPEISEAGFPFLVPPPLELAELPLVDRVLYTHADYDHMAPQTAQVLAGLGNQFGGTAFTGRKLGEFGIPAKQREVYGIGETFQVGRVKITLTPASHSWQKGRPEFDWCYGPEDCCGFFLETADGNIWVPGDSILLEAHRQMQQVDVMFLDVSLDPFHFGRENAVKLANHLDPADLILYHYGTYDAPEKLAFNADPSHLEEELTHPERLHRLAPGEPFVLER